MAAKGEPDPSTVRRAAAREGARRAADAPRSPSLAADLDQLLDAHRGRLRALAGRLTTDPAAADDLVQDTLTVAYRRLPELQDPAGLAPWLFGIARNLARNRRRKRTDELTDDGVLDATSATADALRQLHRDQRAALITEAAAAALDAVEQEAVHLRYVEGVSLDQIDALLGLTGSGARAVLQRSRRKLRRELEARLTAMGRGPSWFRSDAG